MNPDMQAVAPAATFVKLPAKYSQRRAKGIGVVTPFDFALDDECWRWLPPGVPLYVTRTTRLQNTKVTAELARKVSEAGAVTPGVQSLLSADPASIVYACTSGSFIGGLAGEAALCEAMETAGGQNVVTASGALLMALRELGVTRVAIATPYNEQLTRALAEFLESAGIQVVRAGYLDCETDIMHITYSAVRAMAAEINHAAAEAVFFSCTNLRTFGVIASLEAQLGKPVLSANQVMMWAAMKKSGIALPRLPQRLFAESAIRELL